MRLFCAFKIITIRCVRVITFFLLADSKKGKAKTCGLKIKVYMKAKEYRMIYYMHIICCWNV